MCLELLHHHKGKPSSIPSLANLFGKTFTVVNILGFFSQEANLRILYNCLYKKRENKCLRFFY